MLPDNGVGSKFARTRWEARGAPDSFWTVTKVRPKASGRAGKAWGTLTWKGEEKGKEVRIPKAMTAGIWKVVGEEPPRRGPAIPELAAASSASSGSDHEADADAEARTAARE
jgi:small subunit ribosomal protein S34